MAQNVLRSGRAAGGVPASIVYVASESYSFVVTSMFAIRRPKSALVISGHQGDDQRCPLAAQKRTCRVSAVNVR